MAACAAVLLADVWFGGYKTGLQGITTIPRGPIVLYDGKTSQAFRVIAFFSDVGASDVTADATWELQYNVGGVVWDSSSHTLSGAVGSTETIYRDTLRALFGGCTSLVHAAAYNLTQNPDSDHDGIPDQWETDKGLCTNDSGDALQCWFTNGFPNTALSNNLLLFVLNQSPPTRPEYPTNFWVYTATTNQGSADWWRDQDADGIPDGWELTYYANDLNRFSHFGDYDNDGLTDYEEYVLGTNPTDPDTDHDTVNDYWDICPLGQNPLPVVVVRYPEPGSEI